MASQEIDKGDWHDQFEQTLNGNPSDLWQEVLQEGDEIGQPFLADEDRIDLTFAKYITKYTNE